MKTILITALFSLSLISCAQETVKGNGNMNSETRTVNKNFDGVESAGAFDVVINDAAQDGKIKLEGESNILEKIEVEVQGTTLVIKTKKGVNLNFRKAVKVTLNAQNLKSIGLSGSGNITAKGVQKSNDFSVALSGSGDIETGISAQNTNVAISGSGNIKLSGNSNKLKIGISGSGDVNAFGLKTTDTEIGVSGSGDVEVTCSGSLTGAVAGSGDIFYKGNPSKINVKSAGSGDIIDSN